MTDDLTTRTVAELRAAIVPPQRLVELAAFDELCRRAEANAALREAASFSEAWTRDCAHRLKAALAAAPQPAAAPVAPDREAAIEAWRKSVTRNYTQIRGGSYVVPPIRCGGYVVPPSKLDAAVALMRSAPDRGDALRDLRSSVAADCEAHRGYAGFPALEVVLRRIDKMLAAPQPPAPVQPEAQQPAPAAPRADDGVDEAIGDLTLTMLNHDLAPNFCSDLSRVLRLLAARRGGGRG